MAANHDAQFKALLKLKAVLRDFFVLLLPDIACYIHFSQIEFVDKERFTLEGSPRTGDLLIKTRYRDDSAAFLRPLAEMRLFLEKTEVALSRHPGGTKIVLNYNHRYVFGNNYRAHHPGLGENKMIPLLTDTGETVTLKDTNQNPV
jgi:hypothetical protein